MFYQNHSLALHKIMIFCNLILRNHWTWKIWDCLPGLWLTLWYTGLGLAKYLNHLNVVGLIFIIYWKVHRLPNCIWTDFMKYWSWDLKNTWTNLMDSHWFYYSQARILLEKSENLLELSVKHLVIQSNLASSISLDQAMFGMLKTKC